MKQVSKLSVLFVLLFLFGCKENLYSDLSEHDVNMMIAILEQNGIEAERHKDGENKYSLRVEGEDFTSSVKVLSAKGYPKKKFQSLAEVFSEEGFVNSPFKERARFIYALNQELSRSISDIEGVISARVHITQPEISRFGKTKEKPRAAVVILHYPSKSMSGMKPKIKQIIAHAVSGMTYENVTVVMSAVDGVDSRNDLHNKMNINRFAEAQISKTSEDLKDKNSSSSKKSSDAPYAGSYIFMGSSPKQFLSWLLVFLGVVFAGMSVYFWRKANRNDD